MGVMKVMGVEGDTEIEWDPSDEKSVEKAKAEFDKLKADGYEFFEAETVKGKRIKKFSKKAGKLIAAPAAKTKAEKAKGEKRSGLGGGPNAALAGMPAHNLLP